MHTTPSLATSAPKPASGYGPASAHSALAPEFAAMIARMDSLEESGRRESFSALYPDGFMTIGGHPVHAYLYSTTNEVLIRFIYIFRTSETFTEQIINGRETHSRLELSRRVLVSRDGRAWPEVDGKIVPFAKKYIMAAIEVMERRSRIAGAH